MTKYRTKPKYVEAFQYDGDLKDSDGNYYIPDWAVRVFEIGDLYYRGDKLYLVDSNYDNILVEVGNYIVCYGDFPFLSLDVFEKSDFENSFEFVPE